eukprot:CAMPEP_0116879138 /NCGR_PEP_ID=MMETSP0463-20121206/10898_1 /TAXON_ID=181622 /ORGANISM="Strombidinopsis sp, Strain SopsisLIS2011" /LENGTH=46 /DNA_ID= /DNA_START= /DNA_END= /DNA_ORIENTATION=
MVIGVSDSLKDDTSSKFKRQKSDEEVKVEQEQDHDFQIVASDTTVF